MGHIIDREARRRVVVHNRAGAIGVADGRVNGIAQVNRERFVVLELGIAVDQHRDLFGRVRWPQSSSVP